LCGCANDPLLLLCWEESLDGIGGSLTTLTTEKLVDGLEAGPGHITPVLSQATERASEPCVLVIVKAILLVLAKGTEMGVLVL
jgi:hypothetical protein